MAAPAATPPAGLRIERARPGDAGERLRLQRAAYLSEAQLYGDPFISALVESLDQVRSALTGDAVVFKAVLETRLAGFVRAQLSERTCVVGRLAVAPDLRRQGIGTALMGALDAEVTGRATACVLYTGHLSEANLRFGRRLGYTETQRQRVAAHLTQVHLRRSLR